jgi:hypothetical protein
MNPATELETARIDELLAAFGELQAQFDQVRERLRRADEHRATVARRIYDRVRSDYDHELDAIRARLTPLRDELDRVHEALEAQCREMAAVAQTVEEELAEADFRHRIGEYQPVAFDELRRALDARASEVRARHAAAQSALDAIAAARASGAESGRVNAAAPEVAPVTPAATSPAIIEELRVPTGPTDDDWSALIVDEPPSLAQAHEMASSDEIVTAAPEIVDDPRPVPEASADVPSAPRVEGFENPRGWVSEIGVDSARPERRVRLSTPSAPPARAAATMDELDSALAPLGAPVATVAQKPALSPAPSPAPTMASLPSLVFVSGPHVGQAIALLPTTLTIGREHDNNVEIKDPDVARYHARVLRERDAFVVEDLNSSTGTWVNGERKSRAVLSHGDVIRVGHTELALDFEWTTDSR